MTSSRVGIITLPGDANYGNRLQNYALQETIRSLGFSEVESIEGLPRRERKGIKVRRLLATAPTRRAELIHRGLRRAAPSRVADVHVASLARQVAVREFSTRYVQLAPNHFPRNGQTREFVAEYNRFVVGSDQVWNPAYTHGNLQWFLDFAKPEQRVAYAASIGVSRIPNYLRPTYRKGLRLIGALSVREVQAAAVVRDLTGRSVPVVLDPTLLLPLQKWEELLLRPLWLDSDAYIATFLLSSGDSIADTDYDSSKVDAYARSLGLPVVDLYSAGDVESMGLGPEGFVGAIKGATLLITDSFHAAVFAILFHRPFLLVSRGSISSRFATLLGHCDLDDRLLSKAADLERVMSIDWLEVDRRLAAIRARSLDFLVHALGGSRG